MFNTDNIILLLLHALLIAITAWVYSEPLTEPEEIFNGFYIWAEINLPWYFFKPLIGCFKCVSGQWAFWFYLIMVFEKYRLSFFDRYNFIEHGLFIGTTIFFALVVNKFLKKEDAIQGKENI